MRGTDDLRALAPHHGEHRRGRTKITAGEKRCLIDAGFNHYNWSLIEVVHAARKMMAKQGVKESCGEEAYKRFLKKWLSGPNAATGKATFTIREALDHGKVLYNRDGERP